MRNSDGKFDIMGESGKERCNDTSHHMSHLSKTVSSEKRRVTDKDRRRGDGTGEGVSIIFIADPRHANPQVSEDAIH